MWWHAGNRQLDIGIQSFCNLVSYADQLNSKKWLLKCPCSFLNCTVKPASRVFYTTGEIVGYI